MCMVFVTIGQYILLIGGLIFLLWFTIIEIRYQNGQCFSIKITNAILSNSSSSLLRIDSRLKLNDYTILGTHNSYHQSNLIYKYSHPSLDQQLSSGIRQLELDIHIMKNNILVYHVQLFDDKTNCYCLKDCLNTILKWMNQNSLHYPIYLFIEIKQMFYEDLVYGLTGGVKCQHFQQIQQEILDVFSFNQLILPPQIQGNQTSIRLSLKQQRQDQLSGDYTYKNIGWPPLFQSLGKVIPIFLDDVHNKAKNLYSSCDPLRTFFLIAQSKINLPFSSIITISTISSNIDQLIEIGNNGQMTRLLLGYGNNNLDQIYQSSKEYGIHIISSDSVQCNDTTLCQSLNKDFQDSTILCNTYFAPSFCNSTLNFL